MPELKYLLAAAMFALASAAHAQEASCAAPAKPMLRAEIYFGRNIGGHLGVGERQWARFVARELTPRFPDGLTVIDGQGQWRGPSGSIVHEPSKIVIVLGAAARTRRGGGRRLQAALQAGFGRRRDPHRVRGILKAYVIPGRARSTRTRNPEENSEPVAGSRVGAKSAVPK